MRSKRKPDTLLQYWDCLTKQDRALICAAIVQHGELEGFHLGMLPFVRMSRVRQCLQMASIVSHRRIFAEVTAKLGALAVLTQQPFRMYLNPAKVYKWFGKHPERGRPIPLVPKIKVTAGFKWSLPKQAYVPDTDARVSPCVTLRRHSGEAWEVYCDPKYRKHVEKWLFERCS